MVKFKSRMSIGIDPVAAALSLVGLLRDVVKAYTAVGDQIDTWRDHRATLNALAVKLGAIGSTAMQLQDAGELRHESAQQPIDQ